MNKVVTGSRVTTLLYVMYTNIITIYLVLTLLVILKIFVTYYTIGKLIFEGYKFLRDTKF